MEKFDVILPAGGAFKGPLADQTQVPHKTLLAPFGETLLQTGIKAILESGRANRIAVPGEGCVHDQLRETDFRLVPGGTTGPGTILNGLRALRQNGPLTDRLLLVTTDLPFIEARHINEFVDRAPKTADLAVAVCNSSEFEVVFPNSTNTYVKLNDGQWTVGGVFLVKAEPFERAISHLESVFINRKSVLGMVRLLGPKFLLQFALRRVGVEDVIRKVESILGCSGAAVYKSAPELAFDIDDVEDYEYAIAHRRTRA